ncbi:DUF2069 domain-containing protein [Lacimicrobium alkaliphilum]|uniref:DUF2069 domain-containing protein n=1 Tax=Lacimicrobium alkaliphilum TaxID=1526571 RepID=A0A0U3B9T8_9ALTE|nr:DUF2069 domain-containing protein [Lacimicrobium alkaliphilum]ALS98437.1 hypothetical protein AT746_09320 [Lacimicrobium alkaliphilum]
MSPKTRFFRQLALISYLSLLLWVLLWHFLLGEDEGYSVLFITLMWVVPLLFPLSGILRARPYTHAWANFVLMFYLLHGLTAVYALENERLYAAIEIVLASLAFIGCSFFARLRGRELGLGLKKKQAD